MVVDDMQPGEIARLFEALKVQLAEVRDDIRGLGGEVRQRFDALDSKYASRDALAAEIRLINTRQDSYEQQADVKMVGYDAELNQIRREIQEGVDERKANARVAWGAVIGVVTTIASAAVITFLNLHS